MEVVARSAKQRQEDEDAGRNGKTGAGSTAEYRKLQQEQRARRNPPNQSGSFARDKNARADADRKKRGR